MVKLDLNNSPSLDDLFGLYMYLWQILLDPEGQTNNNGLSVREQNYF